MTVARHACITRFHAAECGCDLGLSCHKAQRIAKHYDQGFEDAKRAVAEATNKALAKAGRRP